MVLYWGWLIAIYLFMGGLGAGTYLVSFAAEKGWLGEAQSFTRFGYYLAAPLVALGAGLLVFDLGQGLKKPWLILGMFLNLRSVMTWGIYILSAFIGVGLLKAYFVWTKKKAPNLISQAGAVLALATCAYTGLLLFVVKAVPFWNFYLMPVIFVVSAISTGLSLNSILAHLFEKGELKEGKACEGHLLMVGSEIILLSIFFGAILSGLKGPVALVSAQKILSGSLAWAFWGILIVVGLVIPLLSYVYNLRKRRKVIFLLQAKRESEVMPIAASSDTEGKGKSSVISDLKHQAHAGINPRAIIICDSGVLLGGLVLRCVIVFAAVPIWNGLLG